MKNKKIPYLLAFATAAIFAFSFSVALALDLPRGFSFESVYTGFNFPVAAKFAPDGRIFVVEKNGVVKVIKNGVVLPDPFITLPNVNDYNDRGLLDIAFDPDFAVNQHVYIFYTYEDNASDYIGTKTARLTRVTADGDVALLGSEVVILGTEVGSSCENFPSGTDCIPSDSPSHTIGSIRFASDGSMFVSMGDGASFVEADPLALRSQNLDSLAGKILHINKDGTGIPSNPFYTGDPDDNRSKIWAYGFRNPFRFELDPVSGIPIVGDVGWISIEEINIAKAGQNFGWPCWEGMEHQAGYESFSVCEGLYADGSDVKPVHYYVHPPGAAVIGGTFYMGTIYPAEYQGAYFFGDYARSEIGYFKLDEFGDVIPGSFAYFTHEASAPVHFFIGPDTDLYFVAIFPGDIVRVKYNFENSAPTAEAVADPIAGPLPLTVQFSSDTSNDPDGDPMTFFWDFGDGDTSAEANPSHVYLSAGQFTATLTATDSFAAEDSDSVVIHPGENIPEAEILSPEGGPLYIAGQIVNFEGGASDVEDETFPDSSFSWDLVAHHCPFGDCHTHILLSRTGPTGSFAIPDHDDDTHYELILTVTDSTGLSDTANVLLNMETVTLTFETNPEGLNLIYGGISQPTPFTVSAVVNGSRTIAAPTPQGPNNFTAWSDGGLQQHSIVVPSTATTYTAEFTTLEGGAFFGNYFSNPNLLGSPALSRQDAEINFDWGLSAPDPVVPADNFSVRWVKNDEFEDGIYQFSVTADDGVRLFIDGAPVINEWQDQSSASYTVEQVMTAGTHEIKMEYYENGFDAVAKLFYGKKGDSCQTRGARIDVSAYTSGDAKWYFAEVPVVPGSLYHFSNFNKSNVTTSFVMQVRNTDSSVSYIWLKDIPASADWQQASADIVTPAGAASVSIFHLIRSIGSLSVDSYSFMADGDSVNLIENFSFEAGGVGAPQEWTNNSWGDNASVFTYPAEGILDTVDFCANYFANPNLLGSPVLSRQDAEINFDWGLLAPDPAVPADNFSARWVKNELLDGATYEFTVIADDGVRLFLDGTLVIDQWNDQSATAYTVEQVMTAGTHEIKMEYYENGFDAVAKLFYEKKADICQVKGARVDVSAHSSGDAKWYFAEVPVTPGTLYHFSDYYKSTVTSGLVMQVRKADSSVYYVGLGDLPVSADWQLASIDFVAPPDAVSLTIYHLIRLVGSLNVDDYSLTADGNDVNLIQNPSFELGATGAPQTWANNSWGDNASVFTYPAEGVGVCAGL